MDKKIILVSFNACCLNVLHSLAQWCHLVSYTLIHYVEYTVHRVLYIPVKVVYNFYCKIYTALEYQVQNTFCLYFLYSPVFSKWKTMDQEQLMSALKFYAQTVGCATASSILILAQICALRNFLGRYYKHTAITIPGLSGMSICWFFPQRVINLYCISTSQAAIEVMIRHRSNFLTRLICDSKSIQTILFMVNSAFILHYKRLKFYKGFWFIKPNDLAHKDCSIRNNNDDQQATERKHSGNCSHVGLTCLGFLLSGLKSGLLIGIPIDLFSILLRVKAPSSFNEFFNSIDFAKVPIQILHKFKMTSFLLSYNGIYRLTHCLLQKFFKTNTSPDWLHFVSAFLGGAAYTCLDHLTICMLSLVLTINVLWQWACTQPLHSGNRLFNSVLEKLKCIKFARILVPLNVSYLTHNYLYRHHLVNNLARGFINGVTNSRSKAILESMMASDTQTILRTASEYTKRTTF